MASDRAIPADCAVGLECQDVWCKLILSGEKLEETRRYALPTELLGRRIWLLASSGQAGAPALSDEVPEHSQDAKIVGWVVFSGMQHYTDRAAWVAGRTRHLVDDEGPFGWLNGDGIGIYGWEISDKGTLPRSMPMVAAVRFKRSLYYLSCTHAAILAQSDD